MILLMGRHRSVRFLCRRAKESAGPSRARCKRGHLPRIEWSDTRIAVAGDKECADTFCLLRRCGMANTRADS